MTQDEGRDELRSEVARLRIAEARERDLRRTSEATAARVEALVAGADPAFGAVTLTDLQAALEGDA